MLRRSSTILFSILTVGGAAFSTNQHPACTISPTRVLQLQAVNNNDDDDKSRIDTADSNNFSTSQVTVLSRTLTSAAVSLAILTSPLHLATTTTNNFIANADEWGTETEAPTLFTGETVMICKKRGPLGACLKTTLRTTDNDNDKALKYFKDPSAEVKRKQERMLTQLDEDSEGNTLIQKLRKQSIDNKEKNDNTVRVRTLQNDQGASFGPFSKEVVILNTDGSTFTLLTNPQAMRLKKDGYIEGRTFVIQPSQEVIDKALDSEEGSLEGTVKGFFGGGKDSEEEEESSSSVAVDSAAVATTEESSAVVDAGAGDEEQKVVVEDSTDVDSAAVATTEESSAVVDAGAGDEEQKVVVEDSTEGTALSDSS